MEAPSPIISTYGLLVNATRGIMNAREVTDYVQGRVRGGVKKTPSPDVCGLTFCRQLRRLHRSSGRQGFTGMWREVGLAPQLGSP